MGARTNATGYRQHWVSRRKVFLAVIACRLVVCRRWRANHATVAAQQGVQSTGSPTRRAIRRAGIRLKPTSPGRARRDAAVIIVCDDLGLNDPIEAWRSVCAGFRLRRVRAEPGVREPARSAHLGPWAPARQPSGVATDADRQRSDRRVQVSVAGWR